MRFMLLIKSDRQSEAGVLPSPELVQAMEAFNNEMVEAGVLLAAEGLHPTSRGALVRFSGNGRMVTDGPFPETKEVIAGFWLIEVGSKQEAIDWVLRIPYGPEYGQEGQEGEIEIRQVFEQSDLMAELEPSRGAPAGRSAS